MGRWIGERLNRMDGPVRFFLPEGGVSALDAPGQPFWDPEADAALFRALEQTVRQTTNRQLIRIKRNINDPEFVFRRRRRVSVAARPRGHAAARRGRPCPDSNAQPLLEKFRAMVARGEPIVGGGAGTGPVGQMRGGRRRRSDRHLQFRPLPHGRPGFARGPDALWRRQRDRDRDGARSAAGGQQTPVLAGVNGTDPFRDMDVFLDEIKALGFSGVQNFPTVGLIDGMFRANLEETGMSYALEVDMIAKAHEKDLLTTPYVFSEDEAEAMAQRRRRHHRLPHGPDHRRRDRRAKPR